MPFIIDGHNLLHSIHKTTRGDQPISDIALCRLVSRYLQACGEKGQIIFDGTGPPQKTAFDYIKNLEVVFVGITTDADTVIEDKITASTAPKRLTVVSSDRRLIRAARIRKAGTIKSDAFWDDVQKQLRHKKKFKEPQQKQHGLTESETKQWLEFFGLEQ